MENLDSNYNEPWRWQDDSAIVDFAGRRIPFDRRNLDRIVACVNACEMLKTSGLKNQGIPDLIRVIGITHVILDQVANELEEDGGSKKLIKLLRHSQREIERVHKLLFQGT